MDGWDLLIIATVGSIGGVIGVVGFFPFLMKMAARRFTKSLKGAMMQPGSVNSRLDKNLMAKLVQDLSRPDTPIGSVLSLFPNTHEFLGKHPDRIIGFVQLAGAVPNLMQMIPQLQALLGKGNGQDPSNNF